MIVGDSFDANKYPDGRWNTEVGANVTFETSQTTSDLDTLYNVPSQLFDLLAGTGSAGLSNRGLGNAGMVFEAAKEYEGFIFAKSDRATTVTVSLEDYTSTPAKVLASGTFTVGGSDRRNHVDDNGFARYNFSLTPSASTTCVDVTPGTPAAANISCGNDKYRSPIGHTCVKCGGQFKISLTGKSSLTVNYAFLQPGQWGRVPGLSVLKSAADTLNMMGIKAIRQGGSYASGKSGVGNIDYYQWQKWTGPAWMRESRTDGVWRSCLLAGWGYVPQLVVSAAAIAAICRLAHAA